MENRCAEKNSTQHQESGGSKTYFLKEVHTFYKPYNKACIDALDYHQQKQFKSEVWTYNNKKTTFKSGGIVVPYSPDVATVNIFDKACDFERNSQYFKKW